MRSAEAGAGTRADAWIDMADGIRLAVTLYLPAAAGPQPCILEALPYRKDDMTASYRPEYLRLRDEHSYVVARLDLRGTGSSAGRATDEYPLQEQQDLHEVISWLADQSWCDGNVGMYGTSYSGFNSLQMACEQPPALKAVIAIYATDDRYTDDVHFMGGARKWLDLIDYCHYMTPMNALPPVPAIWGEGWRDEWLARVDEHEPWLLTWLEHQRRDDYWQHGSVRPGYDRMTCAVMSVVGWADGYRNNSFRTMAKLAEAGTPHALLAGPWSHAATSSSLPGPRIDLVPEMVAWWDRWLRGIAPASVPPTARWYTRESHRPAPDLDVVPGVWRADNWPPAGAGTQRLHLDGRTPYEVVPDVGTAAWISCAGHLPYGQPLDQRFDDSASLRWDWPEAAGQEIAGNPLLHLRLSSSAQISSVSAKLCDVSPDGTSTLITRGSLNLTRRGGMDLAQPLPIDEPIEFTVELEATAWRILSGQSLRLSIAGTDWPNVAAPPGPVTLTIHGGTLELPTYDASASKFPTPTFTSGDDQGGEDIASVLWSTTHDVLRRVTSCAVDHGSSYDAPYGSVTEHYEGNVAVNTITFEQTANADVGFTLRYDDDSTGSEVVAIARSTLKVRADHTVFDVTIELECLEDDQQIAHREWHRIIPRDWA